MINMLADLMKAVERRITITHAIHAVKQLQVDPVPAKDISLSQQVILTTMS